MLKAGLEEIPDDIYSQLDEVIDKEGPNPGEQPSKDALKEFFETAIPEFDGLKEQLKSVKGKYVS